MRRIASITVAVSAFCAAGFLAGCGSTASAPAGSSAPPASPSASQTATGTAAATPAPAVPAGWKTHTTSDGSLAFDYPDTWTIKDPADEPAEGGVAVDLISDYGKTMASLRTNMVVGAECLEKSPYMVYDSEPVPALAQGGVTPRFVYEGRTGPATAEQSTGAADDAGTDPAAGGDDSGTDQAGSEPAGSDAAAGTPEPSLALAYGITSAPEPSGDSACPMSHFFTWPPSGAMFGGTYDPFDTTPGKPMHVDTPEAYKDTPEYKNVKQAIMSLRPAGKP